MILVVDTNVPLMANLFPAEKLGCPPKCVVAIRPILQGSSKLALDDAWRIIKEYMHKLRTNEPGFGNEFLKWVLTNHTNLERCEIVTITPRSNGPNSAEDYEEFPRDEDLATFDPPDRKFVAVAAAHPERPPILEAADSKWLTWYPALKRNGILVRFVCHSDLVAVYSNKFGVAPPNVAEDDRA